MRVAIIDLGTNTFNMLIADIQNDGFNVIFDTQISVKLGENGFNDKIIKPLAYERGVIVMQNYKDIQENYNVEKCFAFATSAIRSAKNGKDFVESVKRKTNIDINIINGEQEAEQIYKGVKLTGILTTQASLIIDIGGGSTEFIIANNQQIYWKKSFDIGISRLLQLFSPSDPITKDEIEIITKFFDTELDELFDKIKLFPINSLIGCSGSFESFSEMIVKQIYLKPSLLENINNYKINTEDFELIYNKLIYSNENERKKMEGLVSFRVDTIVYASILTRFIIQKLQIDNIFMSTYALKEGAIYDLMYPFA